jgi:hypothetical protein
MSQTNQKPKSQTHQYICHLLSREMVAEIVAIFNPYLTPGPTRPIHPWVHSRAWAGSGPAREKKGEVGRAWPAGLGRHPGAAGEKSRWGSGQNPGRLAGLTPLTGRPSPSIKEVIRTNPMFAPFYQSPAGLQVPGRLGGFTTRRGSARLRPCGSSSSSGITRQSHQISI